MSRPNVLFRRCVALALAATLAGALLALTASTAVGQVPPRAGGSAPDAEKLRILAADLEQAGDAGSRVSAADSVSRASGTIRTPDGRVVSFEFARADIGQIRSGTPQASEAAAERLAAKLEALADEMPDAGQTARTPDPALLESILAQRDFRGPDPLSRGFAAFVDQVQRWLQRFLGISFGGEGQGVSMPTGVLVALIGLAFVLVAAVAFASIRTLRRAGARSRRRGQSSEPAAASAPDEHVDADPAARAEVLARGGDVAGAIRVLFCGVPPLLVRVGLLDRRGEYTNREMVRVVSRSQPDARAPLTGLVGTFERVFYGGREPSEQEWQAFWSDWRTFAGSVGPKAP